MRAWLSLPTAALWLWGCAQLLSADEFNATTSGAGAGGATATSAQMSSAMSTPESSAVSSPGDVGVGTAVTSSDATSTGTGWMPGSKRIFVSGELHTANMLVSGPNGANAFCETYAANLTPKGTFKAWVATAAAPLKCEMSSVYYLVDKVTLVGTCNELASGKLHHAINMTQYGGMPAATLVWTGAFATGAVTPYTCLNWTWNGPTVYFGTVGSTSALNTLWSNANASQTCEKNLPIYCIEV